MYGRCARLCPEAPVPVFTPSYESTNRGMAANVHENLLALGVNADLITNPEYVKKKRFVDQKTNNILLRIDVGDNVKRIEGLENINIESYDAVIISDYNKGFLTSEDIWYISRKNENTFLDTKKNIDTWADDVRFIKVNQAEYENSKVYLDSCINSMNRIIVTLGSDGCRFKEMLYSVEQVEIKDMSGAGDTFLAALVARYLEANDIGSSIKFANECATKVVQQKGVTVVGR